MAILDNTEYALISVFYFIPLADKTVVTSFRMVHKTTVLPTNCGTSIEKRTRRKLASPRKTANQFQSQQCITIDIVTNLIRCQSRKKSEIFHSCGFIALNFRIRLGPSPWRYLNRENTNWRNISFTQLITRKFMKNTNEDDIR